MAYGHGPLGAAPLGGDTRNGVAGALTVSPTGSEVAAQSGTPTLAFVVAASGSQVAAESGTAGIPVLVPATGSETTAESGTATVVTAGQPPQGNAGWLPWPAPRPQRRPLAVPGAGAEAATESGVPRLVFGLRPGGAEVVAAATVAPLAWVDNESALLALAALVD